MPYSEEMPRVEALLRGVPEEECRAGIVETRRKKREKRLEREKQWRKNYERDEEVREQVRRALEMNGRKDLSPADRAWVNRVLEMFASRQWNPQPELRPEPQTDGNVIHGLWEGGS